VASGEIFTSFCKNLETQKSGSCCVKSVYICASDAPQEAAGADMIRIAAISGALAVAIGAFGAHGLKPRLSPYQIEIFEKGVQYHFVHTLALLAVGILLVVFPQNAWYKRAGWAFLIGIVCFSGSLYGLACKDIAPIPTALFGPVTPIGGLFFMAGWAMLFHGTSRNPS
jgi:uncharacterized membrane protein YgdD (TMEM256/DUF423 family)